MKYYFEIFDKSTNEILFDSRLTYEPSDIITIEDLAKNKRDRYTNAFIAITEAFDNSI